MRIVNRQGQEIRAFHDVTVFHMAKGGNASGKPYGIVPSKYQNPFSLSFSSLTASISPGMLSIYGRQIELTESVIVQDFGTVTGTNKMYCTVYLELNLNDTVSQTAVLAIDISGAYRDIDATGTQENLMRNGAGIYQAPIARFIFDPNSTSPFSGAEVTMPVLPSEARASVQNLRMTDKIFDTPLSDLATESGGIFKFSTAHDAETASTAREFGPRGAAIGISSDLSNIYLVKRERLVTLNSALLAEAHTSTKNIDIDYDHLVAVRIYLGRNLGNAGAAPTISAGWNYGETFLGIPEPFSSSSGTFSAENYRWDCWLARGGAQSRTLSLCGYFTRHTREGALSSITGRLTFEAEGSLEGDDGAPGTTKEARHPYLFVAPTIRSTGVLQVVIQSRGTYSGPSDSLVVTYDALDVKYSNAAICADFIYKGDVRL